MTPESNLPFSPGAALAIRISGWAAFSLQAAFPFIAKGGSWAEVAAWGVSSAACAAGAACYAAAGHWWQIGQPRSHLRSIFRGFILGFATLCGIVGFWLYLFTTLEY